MQQFNPWPRREGGEAAKGAGRKEEQGEAGAASLHLLRRGWRRGAAGGFHKPRFSPEELLFTIWDLAFLNKQAPYSLSHTHSGVHGIRWKKKERSAFFMPSEHWMAMRALRSVFDSHSIENYKLGAFI